MARILDDILETYALLPHFYEPGTAVDDGRQVRGKRIDPPAPIRLDVVALLDRRTVRTNPGDPIPVVGIIETWAQVVREERELEQPSGTRYLTGEIRLLKINHDWIAEQAWVDAYCDELREVAGALHNAIGDHAPRSVGRCPIEYDDGICAGPLYQDRYGGLGVTCRKCGETWDEAGLRRLGLILGA